MSTPSMATPSTAIPVIPQAKVEEVSKLELNMDQKSRILLIQRTNLTFRNTIHELKNTLREVQEKADETSVEMNKLLITICSELNVDPNAVVFQLDGLQVAYKEK